MTWEYLHLLTHSFPIVLTLAGAGVGVAGWLRDRPDLERWGLLALLIGAAFIIPAYVTGLAAADVAPDRTFVHPGTVQTHRIAATWASIPVLLAGILAAFSLFDPKDSRLRRFVLLLGAASAVGMGYAAFLGSRIEHAGVHVPRAGGAGAGRASTKGPTMSLLPEHVQALHERSIVVDGHNDLPWRIRETWGLGFEGMHLDRRLDDGHTDLIRLREGGVDVQFWAAWVPTEYMSSEATVVALEQMDVIKRLAARYPDDLEMAYSVADIRRITGEGKIASLIGIEGGHSISNSIPVLRQLYEAGARYLTLTHSATLAWADAAGDTAIHHGLTDFGRRVVREMNRLGMLVDLSHVTAETMRDALAVTRAPVIFSHSSARAVADHPRNVPDDVLRRVRDNGGVVMVNFFSGFLVPQGARNVRDMFRVEARLHREFPDPEEFESALESWRAEHPTPPGDVGTIADHIDHIVQVAGVDHVGIGSDFDGVTVLPQGMEDVSKLPNLTAELVRRGYSDQDVEKILGANLLRVFGQVEATARALRDEEVPATDRLDYRGPAGT
ncbi:MAG: membrane dipeptidase [Gemmatimonadota bacterium]